jgi:predicted ATP-grasp superfamily ATP-dependent carboligase
LSSGHPSRAACAVVVNAGWVPGVSTIHALGRAGVEVHAVDYRPWALGFRSRYARPVLVPDHHTDEEGFVAALVRLGDSLAAPAPIFAVDDEDLAVLARNRDRLGERFRYPFPDWETLAPIMDKRVQLRRAVELGLPAPASGDEAEFPVLLKPLESVPFRLRFGVKAIRCDSPEELAAARERTSGFETFVVDWIPGGDDALYSLGAYLAPGGEALATFCFRKLRQDPPLLGNGRVVVAASEPLVVEQGLALLRGLGSHGLAHVEVKRDARDGLFKLVEVNSRLWQFHSLATACGVNLPLVAYRHLTGGTVEPVANGHRDGRWAITFKANRLPAAARPPYHDPLLARDDPGIALAHARFIAREAARALRRRARA